MFIYLFDWKYINRLYYLSVCCCSRTLQPNIIFGCWLTYNWINPVTFDLSLEFMQTWVHIDLRWRSLQPKSAQKYVRFDKKKKKECLCQQKWVCWWQKWMFWHASCDWLVQAIWSQVKRGRDWCLWASQSVRPAGSDRDEGCQGFVLSLC